MQGVRNAICAFGSWGTTNVCMVGSLYGSQTISCHCKIHLKASNAPAKCKSYISGKSCTHRCIQQGWMKCKGQDWKVLTPTYRTFPYMTLVQKAMVYDEPKGDMILKLPVQQDASKVASHFMM